MPSKPKDPDWLVLRFVRDFLSEVWPGKDWMTGCLLQDLLSAQIRQPERLEQGMAVSGQLVRQYQKAVHRLRIAELPGQGIHPQWPGHQCRMKPAGFY